jgi:N,N-dimethylformamidase
MALPYITGYTDKISMVRGEMLSVMVSCTAATTFHASLVRIICGDLNPAGPGFKEEEITSDADGVYPARVQICPAGSLIRIPRSEIYRENASFSVQAHIWPTSPERREQGLIAHWDAKSSTGFRLLIDGEGCAALDMANGSKRIRLSSGVKLTSRQWYFVAATYDAQSGTVIVYQEPYARSGAGEKPIATEAKCGFDFAQPENADVIFAAWPGDHHDGKPTATGHYNGKMEKPRLASRALGRLELEQLRQDTIPAGSAPDCLGFWDFSQAISSDEIIDRSKHRNHGVAVNLPARAMTGANWTGDEVCWRADAGQYGAIHFHDDDIYDAGWDPDISFKLPEDMRSGAYAIRLTAAGSEDRIPFFVRPAAGDRRAPVAFLASTATYMAYANLNPVPFQIAELLSSRLIILHNANRLIDEHPEWGPSLYDVHSDGSGVCYSSRLRPMLNIRPGYISSFGTHGSNLREYNADTHILDWLEQTGIDFDVLTDEDLHAEGYALLSQYGAVVTGTHPEYFSAEMWDATKSYTDSGGRLMVLGGNGFYWRIAYHPHLPGVMEVRRSGPAIRTWETQPGEEYHSFDGKRGGLWKAQGRPPQSIGGVGFISEGFDLSAPYRRTAASYDNRASFIFDGVSEDLIGDFGLQGGGAAGIEIDHADNGLGTPAHALILASSEGHTEAYRLVNEEMSITVPTVTAPSEARIQADMVFFETFGGGAVFNTGSIAWAGSLSEANYSNNVARITENVLRRFIDSMPFARR